MQLSKRLIIINFDKLPKGFHTFSFNQSFDQFKLHFRHNTFNTKIHADPGFQYPTRQLGGFPTMWKDT